MNKKKKSEEEKLYFAPGCAVMLYKPELAIKIHKLLNENYSAVELLMTCCRHNPPLSQNSKIINMCPGCDKRFSKDYKGVSTISLWEIISNNNFFDFPDYNGRIMTIIDACPTREVVRVQNAIRDLLVKMNIKLVEPPNTRTESTCCGDIYYGAMTTDKVKELMMEKANEMPVNEIVVHCVSCVMAVFNGGKNPKYIADLLFFEDTNPKTYDLDLWHSDLIEFIESH